MATYSILVLTDHEHHSDQNSLYALVGGFATHHSCSQILVASRSDKRNAEFFYQNQFEHVYAIEADTSFNYIGAKQQFKTDAKLIKTSAHDVIFLRLPRPLSDDFLLALESHFPNTVFINSPSGILKTSNKKYLTTLQNYCPPVRICHTLDDIIDFHSQFSIVLKPLREYGGKGIVRIDHSSVSTGQQTLSLHEYFLANQEMIEKEGMLAMKFLKNVKNGDKRIIVVNGQILAASLRMPAQGSWLCNVAQGGTSIAASPTQGEREMIDSLSQQLLQEGILYFGADTLEDDSGKRVLSEVNCLSIGGFPQAQEQTGLPIIQTFVSECFQYIQSQKQS